MLPTTRNVLGGNLGNATVTGLANLRGDPAAIAAVCRLRSEPLSTAGIYALNVLLAQMPRERFRTLEEAVEMVLANDSAEVTDVVLLPPPSADDILTDEKEGDSDIAIVNTLPNDVAGEVEVHTADAYECEGDMQEQAPPRPRKPCKDPWAWKRTTQYSGAIVETEFQPLQVTHDELVDEEPFDIFARLLNKEIIGLITDESNRYAQQQNDHNDGERECDGGNLEAGIEEKPHGASPREGACHDTALNADKEIAEEFGEEGGEQSDEKVGFGFVLVDCRDDASMRELDDAVEDLGGREAKDGKAEKTRKRWKRKKRNHDEQRGGMWATENKAIVDEAIVVNAVAHVRENESENNSNSYMEAAAKEGEALLKELGLKDNNVPDSGRRRTRSQTRGTTAAPAERKTPTKPARGAKKAAASKRSNKEESEEEEEEEAASAKEASTTAAYEDGSADSIEKKDEKDKQSFNLG
ncbi:hypothetical protein HPB52_000202 [Rhipicephalus sanguineus]|uniref:Uncharacterized protein n=1 Tax=Rhipicephalus sanguineus TaxID=34632 RepID=A0A9D4PJA8_RHISA|nr:hypothetical protein HPB52_000202 [Rhipicephalus sanguineus]